MARCLIVLNETLGGDDLLQEVRTRSEQGCTFRLLAPANGADVEHGVAASGPISSEPAGAMATDQPGTPAIPADRARLWADDILREAWAQLEEAGAEVEAGEVGDPDPLEAIERTLEAHDIDEIIIATPPQHLAKLVSMDMPSKAARRFDVPVTAVTGPPSAPPSKA